MSTLQICNSQLERDLSTNSGPISPVSQTKIISGNMHIMLASRFVAPLFVLLLKANAAKLDDNSLYDVVEGLPGNETKEKENGGFTTCLDIMARNGQISLIFKQPSFIRTDLNSAGLNFSSFWQAAAHGLHSLHLEEIR